jgi:diguanylate cyclase (GGDEF)-like protein
MIVSNWFSRHSFAVILPITAAAFEVIRGVRSGMSEIVKRLEKAERYLQKGKPEAALEEFLEVLKEDPRNDGVRQTAADLCLSLGRERDAAELLSDLFDHAASLGDAPKAIAFYKRLIRFRPPSVQQVLQFAHFSEKSNKREAIDAYEAAFKALVGANRKQEGLAVLNRIVKVAPTLRNHQRLGDLAAEIGENKVAASAYVAVAVLQERENEDPSSSYERAHELDSGNPAAILGHGRCLLERGNAELAAALLEPIGNYPSAPVEAREAYGRALLASGRLTEAAPLVWQMFERDAKHSRTVLNLVGAFLDANEDDSACQLAVQLEEFYKKAGTRREFVNQMKELADSHRPQVQFLEYMVELYNSSNREHDYCDALLKLFEMHFASGAFLKAADALDRAAEVDPYEPGHQGRLEMLRGKIDSAHFNAIANRFTGAITANDQAKQAAAREEESETTVLEDLILQTEIFLQYSMRPKAIERLDRIMMLFPHEEDNNEKLMQLYLNAGFVPQYSDKSVAKPAPATSRPAAESGMDSISRVTEITRNIYRQSSVKGVLFAAVNDIGRHWNASRCVAGLITPGKPPSAAMEYCAPGIKQSEVTSIVKLIQSIQTLCVKNNGSVSCPNTFEAAELESIRPELTALNIHSILAIALQEGDEHVGVLILEQCGVPRQWQGTDHVVVRTIAEQMVLAVNNARLRSLVKNLAVTDEKSGLLKRSSYLNVLLSEVKRSQASNSPLSVMLLDFGKASTMVREIGEGPVESFMQQVGQLMASHIRQNDVAVRYDLTQIALILADTNDKNAFFVVDKMRKLLNNIRVPVKDSPVVTTIGIAEAVLRESYDPVDIVTEVINRAEDSLWKARSEGGNIARSLAPAFAQAAAS